MSDDPEVVMQIRLPVEAGTFAQLLKLAANEWPECRLVFDGKLAKIVARAQDVQAAAECKPDGEAGL